MCTTRGGGNVHTPFISHSNRKNTFYLRVKANVCLEVYTSETQDHHQQQDNKQVHPFAVTPSKNRGKNNFNARTTSSEM